MTMYQATVVETYEDLFSAGTVPVVEIHRASTPIEADLIVSEQFGMSPEINSIAVLGPTSIRVNFEYSAVDNAALRNVDNYVISPELEVFSVTPEVHSTPSYVDLEIDEQKTGTEYTLTLQRIVKA